MSWFNDLTEEDKKKVILDEVFLVRREPVGTKHFPGDPKSPEHKTTNIEEQTSKDRKSKKMECWCNFQNWKVLLGQGYVDHGN